MPKREWNTVGAGHVCVAVCSSMHKIKSVVGQQWVQYGPVLCKNGFHGTAKPGSNNQLFHSNGTSDDIRAKTT